MTLKKSFAGLRGVSGLILQNWRAFITFELLYKLALAAVVLPLLGACFGGIMDLTGYPYLTAENVFSFLKHPLTILLIAGVLLLAATFTMVDISAVIYTLDQSRQQERARMYEILLFSVKNSIRIWLPQNFLLAVVVLGFMPFLNMGIATGVFNTLSLPGFVREYIKANRVWSVLFVIGIILLIILMVRWLYALHYYTLEGCSFYQAHRKSSTLSKSHRIGDFLTMLVVQGLFAAGQFGLSAFLVMVTVRVSGLFQDRFILHWLTGTGIWIVILLTIIVAFALSTPVNYAVVSTLFYHHKNQAGEEEIHIPPQKRDVKPGKRKTLRRVFLAAGCLFLAAAFGFGYLIASGRVNPQIEYVRTMEITAHRGASAVYPENTMAAFQGAWELGADWIELDVQQTRDGQLIIMHDSNTKRTTGVNGNVWEMDYAEIEKLDAGSFFSSRFAGEKIPLLAEAAEFSKETGIRLNIELKPTGHEIDFEKAVVDIIHEYNMENDCVITSQSYGTLERVKEYDPEIVTVYVMSLAYGNITKLTAADHFSVEASSATGRLVSRVHNAGKQIYAWTVNSESSINSMIERNVDNIITDNIPLARQCVENSRYSDLLTEFIKRLK